MDVRDYIDSNAREFFGQLKAWLAIPSISADPGHADSVRSSAQWLAAQWKSSEQLFAAVALSSLLGLVVFWGFGLLGRLLVGSWHDSHRTTE